MNVLFITNELYPNLNANSDIVYKLARKIQENTTVRVSIMGYSSVEENVYGISVERIKSLSEFHAILEADNNKIIKMLKLLIHPKALIVFISHLTGKTKQRMIREYKKAIRQTLRNKKIDLIIGFSEPCEILKAITQVETNVPFIAYKMDPWSSHYTRSGNIDEYVQEKKCDEKAAAIVLPNYIHAYQAMGDDSIENKTKILELPNIVNYGEIKRLDCFDQNKINCVFAGGMYKDIRNPEYAISLLGKLEKDNIVFHIWGRECNGKVLPDILPSNVIYHGVTDSDSALNYIKSADILINIGNTICNQLPSKLITYISLGKPIINFVKIADCPTIEYLKKYPLAINIFECNENKEEVERVRTFCINSKGKGIPYDEIKEKYRECTLEFVSEELYMIMTDIYERNI